MTQRKIAALRKCADRLKHAAKNARRRELRAAAIAGKSWEAMREARREVDAKDIAWRNACLATRVIRELSSRRSAALEAALEETNGKN